MNELLTEERVLQLIHKIRNQKVMLDSDLAEIYGVPTKRLNEQVKRNLDRFPDDFMFQLNQKEWENLKSQIATASWSGIIPSKDSKNSINLNLVIDAIFLGLVALFYF